jgi:hypothetical protein
MPAWEFANGCLDSASGSAGLAYGKGLLRTLQQVERSA